MTSDLDDEVRMMEPDWWLSYPYDVFHRLRDEAPVYYSERDGIWAITKYDDIRQISMTPSLFANAYHIFAPAAQIVGDGAKDGGGPLPPNAEARRRSQLNDDGHDRSIVFADGARHRFLRRLAGYAFTPKAVARLEAEVEILTRKMLMEIEPEVEVDFIDTVAAPVPVIMIARLLGVPDEHIDKFRRWSDALLELSEKPAEGEDAFGDVVTRAEEFRDYFTAELENRKQHPRDDLLTTLVEAEFEGEHLSLDEQIQMTMILLTAGNETTRSLLSGTGRLLYQFPDQRTTLRESPELITPAVEEFLRVVSPVTHMCRTALEDTEIRGQKIAKGDYLCLLYPSANRDEDIWDRSEELDVTRTPDPVHVAFGFAEHFCLGASLARREARIVISGLLKSFSSWDVTGEVTRAMNPMTPGLATMPVVFHR